MNRAYVETFRLIRRSECLENGGDTKASVHRLELQRDCEHLNFMVSADFAAEVGEDLTVILIRPAEAEAMLPELATSIAANGVAK